MANINNPLIIQSDETLFLEVHNERYEEIRDKLSLFAELVKSPEHIHTYRITPISLWNAASAGLVKEEIYDFLELSAKYDIPQNVFSNIKNTIEKFGKIKLHASDKENTLILTINNSTITRELENHKDISKILMEKIDSNTFFIHLLNRGLIKQKLIEIGYPVDDQVGFVEGEKFNFTLRDRCLSGQEFKLRPYQQEAANTFYQNGQKKGGHGVVVLPCGSGKTMTGMAVMNKIQCSTLILTTNIAACHQWIHELLDKTSISKDDIGEFSGERKLIKPITVATYQIIIYRNKDKNYPYFSLFRERSWGLIIYDEVHLLPAPVFRITAEIQSMRRLGLTATLIREDGKEKDVFSLIGPKRYDVPWKELEKKGYIAEAVCHEIRVPMNREDKLNYITIQNRGKFRIASTNKNKIKVTEELLFRHREDQILIIGQYLDQLEDIAKQFNYPIITGKINNKEREKLYHDFRSGEISVLVVSKVANFAIDLPDASVAIQISGTYGSRQEEAQRLGRILRPKKKTSFFYSIITKESNEEEFAHKRQLFLTEQGYKYFIEDWSDEFILDKQIG
ncbi:MAG: DEAD/DEAH box helicase [Spirochaetota bacterium]|nr:DEAD/DEAH box helicase [Spirochaetota bacterium]